MPKYRKKPVVIEAFQLGIHEHPLWFVKSSARVTNRTDQGEALTAIIPTPEGDMLAAYGDWIIQGIKGEIYPCKPDIFEATYEPADDLPEASRASHMS